MSMIMVHMSSYIHGQTGNFCIHTGCGRTGGRGRKAGTERNGLDDRRKIR